MESLSNHDLVADESLCELNLKKKSHVENKTGVHPMGEVLYSLSVEVKLRKNPAHWCGSRSYTNFRLTSGHMTYALNRHVSAQIWS